MRPERRGQVGQTIAQIFSFGLIGIAGFAVDSAVLYAAIFLGLGLYAGRAVSYLAAVSFTWALNRRFTFRRRATGGRLREWRRFAASQLAGAVVNLGAYAALVHASPYCAQHPIAAVAVGSLMGMMVNYLSARRYVFQVSPR